MTNHPIAEQDSLEALIANLRFEADGITAPELAWVRSRLNRSADTLSQMRDALVEARAEIKRAYIEGHNHGRANGTITYAASEDWLRSRAFRATPKIEKE